MIVEGVIPFIEAYVEKMTAKGTRKDREMLATIGRRLSKVRGEKNNVFGLFQGSFKNQISNFGQNFLSETQL